MKKIVTSLDLSAVFAVFLGLSIGGTGLCAETSAPATALSPDVVAKFGNTQVKTEEIRAQLNSLDSKQRESLAHDPELLKKTVSAEVVQRLVLKEALIKNWDKQPAVVAELKRVRENALVQSYLQAVCKPPSDYPTAAEVQSVYEANKASLLVPRQYEVAQIFVSCPVNADVGTIGVAQSKFETVKKSLSEPNADFAAVAKAVSDDKQSAGRGGEIGWITESQIQPEIRSQVIALAKGATSEPIQLKDGWHFLKLLNVKEAQTATLDQVRDQLVTQMRTLKTQANTQTYLAKLLQQNPVTLNEPALAGLLKKDTP